MPRIPKPKRRNRAYYLRVWRAERDLTVAQAAALFNLHPSHWSLMESGKRNASPKVAAHLAAATGQPIEMFLGIAVPK